MRTRFIVNPTANKGGCGKRWPQIRAELENALGPLAAEDVAITRARRRLYLSFAQSRLLHGQTRYGIKSRFLEELPQEAVKWLTPRVPAYAGGRFGQWHDAGLRPAAASATLQRPAATHGFRVGQSVRHPKFGEGVIVNLEGSGDDARAQVNFGVHGVKWLLVAVAKLAAA